MSHNHIITVSLFALLFNSGASAGEIYSHSLPGFAYALQNDCSQAIAKVAEEFAKESGVSILGTECRPAQLGELWPSGEISYSHIRPISIVTSDIVDPMGTDAPYKSYQECIDSQLREKKVMIRVFGRAPFVDYCYESGFRGRRFFRGRMDVISHNDRRKFVTSARWVGPKGDHSTTISEVSKLFGAVDLFNAQLEPVPYGQLLTVSYYGNKQLYLQQKARAYYQNAADCLAQKNSINQRWPIPALASYFTCVETPEAPTQLLHFWLSTNALDDQDLRTQRIAGSYPSVSECDADRSRIEAILAEPGPIATLCTDSEDPNTATMIIIRPTKPQKIRSALTITKDH
jgi:hypothetical protein